MKERTSRDHLIVLIGIVSLGVIVGTITDYNFLLTIIAGIMGAVLGKILTKVLANN